MKRKVYAGYIGFQPANDAEENFVELSEELIEIDGRLTSESQIIAEELAKGTLILADDLSKTISSEDEKFLDEMKKYLEAANTDSYQIGKNEKAKKYMSYEDMIKESKEKKDK